MLSAEQAHQILNAICIAIVGKPASTHKNPQNYKREDAAYNLEWWLDSPDQENPYQSRRYEAYLRAYLAMGGNEIIATGIPLHGEKYLRPDKGIMKALLVHELVALNNGIFQLTRLGQAYLNGEGLRI
jgi:hypothetical protein